MHTHGPMRGPVRGPVHRVALEGIEVLPPTISIKVLNSVSLSVTALFDNILSPPLTTDITNNLLTIFSSSNPLVAIVVAGSIQALTPGTTTITISYKGKIATCNVTVTLL
jgi:hypothetical protein